MGVRIVLSKSCAVEVVLKAVIQLADCRRQS